MRKPAALAAVLLLAACAAPAPTRNDTLGMYTRLEVAGSRLDQTAALDLINAYRANRGLRPLTLDPALSSAAQDAAEKAASEDRSTFGEMPTLMGQGGQSTSIKLSAGYLTMAEAFSGWRDVPIHNGAMLNPAATRMGIAAVRAPSAKYRVYWALATSS